MVVRLDVEVNTPLPEDSHCGVELYPVMLPVRETRLLLAHTLVLLPAFATGGF